MTELNLNGTAVKGDGLAHLKGLVGLKVIELPAVEMTIKQVAPLATLRGLERFAYRCGTTATSGSAFWPASRS